MAATEAVPAGAPAVERILVVDDDPDIRRLLCARLASRGYAVNTAADGEEALDHLAGVARPDVLFLDVSMPGVGGMEVLQEIRTRALDIAVVMTTAFGSEQVAIDALRRGADDYLPKPFERHEFEAVLERTVSRLRLRRQNAELRRQLDEKRLQLEAELARAAQVQAELLPRGSPRLDGFELAARCVPARDVGGDFYDWQEPRPGALTLTLGDVMGKGMPAALLMATARAVLRAVGQEPTLAAVLDVAGRALEADFERSGSFVTVFQARLDVASRCLTYVDAGHGYVFVRHADGSVAGLGPRGLPLGLLPGAVYEEGRLVFEAGDALVVYSDGLLETWPEADANEAQLVARLRGVRGAAAIADRLVEAACAGGTRLDDVTVVVLCCRDAE